MQKWGETVQGVIPHPLKLIYDRLNKHISYHNHTIKVEDFLASCQLLKQNPLL
jgi:hypothetical protein